MEVGKITIKNYYYIDLAVIVIIIIYHIERHRPLVAVCYLRCELNRNIIYYYAHKHTSATRPHAQAQ